MWVVLNQEGYQLIEQFILQQFIQVLTPDLNWIIVYEDQKEVGEGGTTLKVFSQAIHMKYESQVVSSKFMLKSFQK